MYWSDRATQWAQATGDYPMVAYLLIRKSNIALLDHDAREVIDLAAAARKVPGADNPRLHALAAQQEARGWALYHDADQSAELANKVNYAAFAPAQEQPIDLSDTAS